MKAQHIVRHGVLLAVGIALAGCVPPGEIDQSILYRLQQHLVETGPQARQANNLVRQVAGSTGEPMKLTKNVETDQIQVELTLEEVVRRTLRNNTSIKVVGYDPAIAREEVIQAAAVFDVIAFGSVGYSKSDRRSTSTFLSTVSDTKTVEAGLRKTLPGGGQTELKYGVNHVQDNTPFAALNNSYTNSLSFQLTQPLLRSAGPEVVLSRLRIARLNHTSSLTAFRGSVMDVITEVQNQYWQLVRAREDLRIQVQLEADTVKTLEQVKARGDMDATGVQVSQTEATLAQRRAFLIRVRKQVLDAQDQLVKAMADASFTLLDDYEIVPTTPLMVSRITVSAPNQVVTALKYSPELAQARLAIQISDITVKVGKRQLLPQLDLSVGVGVNGLARHYEDSWAQMASGDFMDFNIGLSFERPLPNRGARSALRRVRHERNKNIAAMQKTAEDVAMAVKNAVRQIDATYAEMKAMQKVREGYVANLRAIEAREEFNAAKTPEFLNLRLDAQENVANAERALMQSKTDYNVAHAFLSRITGTSFDDMGVVISDGGLDPVELMMQGTRLTGGKPQPAK